jgi:hypothetical protein
MAKGTNPGIVIPGVNDASSAVRTALQQIVTKLGLLASPKFASMQVGDLSGVLKATAGLVSGNAQHSDLGGVSANQHHNQVHTLDGPDHTVSGLTPGTVLTALTATTFGFAAVSGGGNSLLLDQSIEQHVTGGAPHFDNGVELKAHQKLYFDGV